MANGFSLQEFMSARTDFARGYTFYATFPSGMPGTSLVVDTKYLVKSTSLPVGTITPIETDWQGNKYKIAGTQEFTDFTITFNVDPDSEVRKSFVEWQTLIHNPGNNEHGIPGVGNNGYMTDILLEHLSHLDGSTKMTYLLLGAWPTAVGEMALDYSSQEVATFDVTFVYQRHEVNESIGKA